MIRPVARPPILRRIATPTLTISATPIIASTGPLVANQDRNSWLRTLSREAHVLVSAIRDRDASAGRFVYILYCDIAGLAKIGVSDDVPRRVVSIQKSCPTRLALIAIIADPANVEIQIHDRFRDRRRHSEWFAVTRRDLDRLIGAV